MKNFKKNGQKTLTLENGETIKGHVLKTRKMRGVYSQGLILPLENFNIDKNSVKTGENVSKIVGIYKYEEPLPNDVNIIGSFDSRFSPKTDAERLQNLTEQWENIKKLDWEPTIKKIDGRSQTLINDNGNIRIFGRNWELDKNTSLGYEIVQKEGIIHELLQHNGMSIQGELAGEKNNNRLSLPKPQFFVFSVWNHHKKIAREEWPEILLKNSVPVLDKKEWKPTGTIEEMIEKVFNNSFTCCKK